MISVGVDIVYTTHIQVLRPAQQLQDVLTTGHKNKKLGI